MVGERVHHRMETYLHIRVPAHNPLVALSERCMFCWDTAKNRASTERCLKPLEKEVWKEGIGPHIPQGLTLPWSRVSGMGREVLGSSNRGTVIETEVKAPRCRGTEKEREMLDPRELEKYPSGGHCYTLGQGQGPCGHLEHPESCAVPQASQ